MSSSHTQNFDITILGTETPYTVVADYQGLTADGFFYHDALQPDWVQTIGVLAATQSSVGEDGILDTGGLLFSELFHGKLRRLWIEAVAQLEAGQRLRVRLNIQPPAVAALPWETLTDASRRRLLAADRAFSLVRIATSVEFVGRARSIHTELPAKLLIVAVDDREIDREIDSGVDGGERANSIDSTSEIARIQAALSAVPSSHMQIEVLQGQVDIQMLRRALEQHHPDILHIISHGEADGLYLWGENGLTLVKSSQIAAMLALVDSIKLVFLNACLVGQPDNTMPFASLAQRLLQTGIPAVIAMQFQVLDRVAAEFAGFLYDALVSGPQPGAIDVATSIARSGLYINDPDRIDFATPLLWLNAPDGMILQMEDPDTLAGSYSLSSPLAALLETPFPTPLTEETLSSLALEIDERQAWFEQLPENVEPFLELRFDYADRKAGVKAALQQLQQTLRMQPVDIQRLTERLATFDVQRQSIDNMLARLNQSV